MLDYEKFQKERYSFNITIFPGCDEWWELVQKLPTLKKRREEVKAEIIRTMADHGFLDGDNIEIKTLTDSKK